MAHVQPFGSHRRMRWANGAGVTFEVIAVPSVGPWDLRVTIAEIDGDAPFSVMPGVDRRLVLVDGGPIVVHTSAGPTTVGRFDTISFDGGDHVRAELLGDRARVVNLMTVREQAPAMTIEVGQVLRGEPVDIADAVVAIVLDGALSIVSPSEAFPYNPARSRVSRLDALFPGPVDTPGDGEILAVADSTLAVARIIA